MSAYPLAHPVAFASSAILLCKSLRVVACSLDRPPERALAELLRSDQVCCVPVGSSLSAGSRGGSREPHRCSRPLSDRDHFGQSLLPRVGSFTVTTVHRAFACANHRNLRSGEHLVEVQTLPHFSLLHGLTTNLYHEGAAFPLSPRG